MGSLILNLGRSVWPQLHEFIQWDPLNHELAGMKVTSHRTRGNDENRWLLVALET